MNNTQKTILYNLRVQEEYRLEKLADQIDYVNQDRWIEKGETKLETGRNVLGNVESWDLDNQDTDRSIYLMGILHGLEEAKRIVEQAKE